MSLNVGAWTEWRWLARIRRFMADNHSRDCVVERLPKMPRLGPGALAPASGLALLWALMLRFALPLALAFPRGLPLGFTLAWPLASPLPLLSSPLALRGGAAPATGSDRRACDSPDLAAFFAEAFAC